MSEETHDYDVELAYDAADQGPEPNTGGLDKEGGEAEGAGGFEGAGGMGMYRPPFGVGLKPGSGKFRPYPFSKPCPSVTSLGLLVGEKEVACAPGVTFWETLCCGRLKENPNQCSVIRLTDKRITFRWVEDILLCLPEHKMEESFSYRDVQHVWVQHGKNFSWLLWAVVWFIIGVILVAIDAGVITTAIGAVLIIIGVGMSIWWVCELFVKGTYLVLNFGRPGVRVPDWYSYSGFGGSSTRRFIRLRNEDAYMMMYTILQHPLVYNGRPHAGASLGML